MPQIHTRTYARAVIAVLGLAACGGASRSAPTTTASSIDLGPQQALRAEFASSFTRGFQAEGLTITADQANCMADGVFNEFGMDQLGQLMRDAAAGMLVDPAVLERGEKAMLACLPADVAAALAKQ